MRPLWQRALESVRSFIRGPFNLKDKGLGAYFGSGASSAGVPVDEGNALTISAYWCGVNLISGHVGMLPLELMRRKSNDKGAEPYFSHPTYELVHDAPNPEMTSVLFRQTLQAHALTWGNGYAEIQRDGAGRPLALWPLTPDRVYPYREFGTGELSYQVWPRLYGVNRSSPVDVSPENILHVPGLGYDGTRGYSVVALARESLGLSLATEKYGAQFFGNAGSAGGVLQHPKAVSPEVKEALREQINEHISGENRRRPLLLEEGMTWTQLGIPPDDGQFLETRKLQVTEVARWLNIPPHKLKDLERSTFSNIEAQNIDYLTDTLLVWLVKWEQELQRKLIRPLERKVQYFKHNVKGLLRGDQQSRYAAYAVARNWGWMSANDVLRLEDENPIGPDGDIYLQPVNMVEAGAEPPAPVTPAPPTPDKTPPPDSAAQARMLIDALRQELEPVLKLSVTETRELTVGHLTQIEEVMRALKAEVFALSLEGHEVFNATTASVLSDLREQIGSVLESVRASDPPDVSEQPDAAMPPEPAAGPTRTSPAAGESGERGEHFPDAARQRAKLILGHRSALHDAMSRIVRRETSKASRCQTPDRLRAWLEAFYVKQAPVFEQILCPAVQAHLALADPAADAADVTRALVREHVDAARADLLRVLESDDFQSTLSSTLKRWEQTRASTFADTLVEKEVSYAADAA